MHRILITSSDRVHAALHAEIHCDAANAASGAVARRLGSELLNEADGEQLWRQSLAAERAQ